MIKPFQRKTFSPEQVAFIDKFSVQRYFRDFGVNLACLDDVRLGRHYYLKGKGGC
jgi:hypothetical protein